MTTTDSTVPAPTRGREALARAIGERIHGARAAVGISQSELARRLGCTPTAVSYWETGDRLAGVDVLADISAATGVSIVELIPIDDAPLEAIRAAVRGTGPDAAAWGELVAAAANLGTAIGAFDLALTNYTKIRAGRRGGDVS